MTGKLQRTKNTGKLQCQLFDIFRNEPTLAWQLVQQQCNVYTQSNIDVQQINKLTSIYCKIVQKLNSLQDPRQKYFHNKMQKLMAEPFVIRCYNNHAEKKEINQLDQKRKQLQMKLSLQAQRQNSQSFQHILNAQNQKQKKIKSKISQILEGHEKKLETRLQQRTMRKMHSPKKKTLGSGTMTNSDLTNPQFKLKPEFIPDLQLTGLKDNKGSSMYGTRAMSQRTTLFYNFNKDSSDSDDEYQIQKGLEQEKGKKLKEKRKKLEF